MQSPAGGALCRPVSAPCCSVPMSMTGVRRSSSGSRRRTSPPVTMRDTYGTSSVSSSSGSCKGSDGSPTPRRSAKYTLCSDNHGIKPPTPEQYLTPLQQKEVCIRHLRSRLKDMHDAMHERDSEVDELRSHLSRMQEDWIEEECHRVEAQLALKAAQHEIQQLRGVMENVQSRLSDTDTGVQKYFADINQQNRKLETLLQSVELAQDGAEGGGSAGGSPARSLTRSSTYTKLSERPAEDTGDSGYTAPDDSLSRSDPLDHSSAVSSGTECCLGEGPPCLGARPPPLCAEVAVQASSVTDCGVQTDAAPGTPDPDAILEKVLQSHVGGSPSCSPWDPEQPGPLPASPDPSCVVLVAEGGPGGEAGTEEPDAPLSYWSRYFVVDLLAVLIPVVPTVAWLCRAQRQPGQPVYNISSLMRGCCSVALHSIRRISCRPVSAPSGQP